MIHVFQKCVTHLIAIIVHIAKSPENHGEIWIKTVNIGDLWSRMKRSKTQCNIGAGKEII